MKINQTFFENIAIYGLFIFAALLWLYVSLVWKSFDFYTKTTCSEKGYANHKTTLSLDKYCIDKDGNVIKI